MRNPLKRFRHSYAELNKLITKRAGISLLLFVYIQNYTEEKQRSAALAALSRFAVLRSKTASLKCTLEHSRLVVS